MTAPARSPFKSPTPPTGQPNPAKPTRAPDGSGAPKLAARQGVHSALRPEPHQADGRYPVAWLHITAPPERNVTPYATSWCQCGHEASAMGHRAVLRLINDHTEHRAVCPLRTAEGRNPA
ncbi:hypothetical protein [Streptomyces netropsis]|uniref:Uncharacterized protein n=1 Tax=Streptomyces netropsis TaxID=55404 RepID=A0A7W7LHB6_STRNE|nr:hypothetical protein [Streptomyces netropsis]MBB4889927.1 hypothetical protein [Streptomyces netropsis]GGR43103.1 hypothetical protein GCM10010219_55880 [Streptomyces netropsis]